MLEKIKEVPGKVDYNDYSTDNWDNFDDFEDDDIYEASKSMRQISKSNE